MGPTKSLTFSRVFPKGCHVRCINGLRLRCINGLIIKGPSLKGFSHHFPYDLMKMPNINLKTPMRFDLHGHLHLWLHFKQKIVGGIFFFSGGDGGWRGFLQKP